MSINVSYFLTEGGTESDKTFCIHEDFSLPCKDADMHFRHMLPSLGVLGVQFSARIGWGRQGFELLLEQHHRLWWTSCKAYPWPICLSPRAASLFLSLGALGNRFPQAKVVTGPPHSDSKIQLRIFYCNRRIQDLHTRFCIKEGKEWVFQGFGFVRLEFRLQKVPKQVQMQIVISNRVISSCVSQELSDKSFPMCTAFVGKVLQERSCRKRMLCTTKGSSCKIVLSPTASNWSKGPKGGEDKGVTFLI